MIICFIIIIIIIITTINPYLFIYVLTLEKHEIAKSVKKQTKGKRKLSMTKTNNYISIQLKIKFKKGNPYTRWFKYDRD